MSASEAQQAVFEASAGLSMGQMYFLVSSILIALYGALMLKLGKGSLKGFSVRNVDGYELLSRGFRLILIFNVLLYLVAV